MQFITINSKRRNFITFLTLAIFFTLSTSFVSADTPDRVFGDVQILGFRTAGSTRRSAQMACD